MIEITERNNTINCTTCEHYKVCRLVAQVQEFEVKDIPHFIQVSISCIHYKPTEIEPIKPTRIDPIKIN